MFDLSVYFLVGFIIILFETTRKRYFILDHILFFNIFFMLVYSFTPIMLLINGKQLISHDMPYGHEYFNHNIWTSITVLSAYLLFLVGYNYEISRKSRYKFKYQTKFNEDLVVKILPFAFFILYLFLSIYVSEFGGIKRAIELAEAYRSGAIAFHKFGFLQRFFALNSILLYYLYFKVILQKEKKHRYKFILFFILSIIFSLTTMAIYSSRGFVIFELTGLYVITAIYHRNLFLKFLIPSLIIAFLTIKYGRILFDSISELTRYGFDAFINGFSSRVEIQTQESESIISNFTHPIISLEASLQRSGVDIDLRYFKDIIYAILSLLPSKLFGIQDPQNLMELNTLILKGKEVEEILPGILGFFSYSLSTVGVLLGSFIYGLLGGFLYKIFITFYNSYKSSIVFIYMLSLSYGYFVFRGDPQNLIQEKFIFMVTLFVILFNSKFIIKYNHDNI